MQGQAEGNKILVQKARVSEPPGPPATTWGQRANRISIAHPRKKKKNNSELKTQRSQKGISPSRLLHEDAESTDD